MARIGVYLTDDVEKRLKDYVYSKTGSFRGQSEIAAKAIVEYLDRHEEEALDGGQEDPLKAPVTA